MEITFLGTGTSGGVPMIGCNCKVCTSTDKHDKRLRSSVLVRTSDAVIVIDSGPDFRYQMLREGVTSIDAIIYTHDHKDHTGGLDDVRALNYTLGRAIDVYGRRRVLNTLKKDFDYAFHENKYPGVPEIELHEIDAEPFYINKTLITPIQGLHYKLPVLGFRIGNFAYITDMNHIPPEELDKLRNLDTLVICALRREKHLSHFSLPESLNVIAKLKPRHSYLTHMSHQIGLHSELEAELPAGVLPAYDRMKININD